MTKNSASHFDRRKQPQILLQAIETALAEIDWAIKETTSQRFWSPQGVVNESFGYVLKVPKKADALKGLWVGYLAHEKLATPGIYAAAIPSARNILEPLKAGYRETPFDFGSYVFLKPIVSKEKVDQMQKLYGPMELEKRMKHILKTVYPFSLKL